MTRCVEIFEELSAWMDEEASAAETGRVEEHLAACPRCRGLADTMGEVSRLPVPPEPAGLAARAAARVRRDPLHRGQVGLRRSARWFDGLTLGSVLPTTASDPHPVTLLLQTRAVRAGVRSPSRWLLLALLVYGIPALLLGAVGLASSGRFFLMASGLGLLVALPLYHFRTDLTLLTALVRGRCLEEILSSGLSAAGIVDALARYSLVSLLRVGWPVALVLLAGTALFPADEHAMAVAAAALWLPAVAGLLAVGSYAVQATVAFRNGGGASPASLGVAALLGIPALGGMALAASEAGGGHVAGALAAGAAVVAWVSLVGRRLAAWGLENSPLVRRWARAGRSAGRNRWIRPWGDNPIVIREARRQAASVPLGLVGLIGLRLGATLLPAAGLWALARATISWQPVGWWLGAAALAGFAFLRAAARTSTSVAAEREAGTLDPLIQSGLTSDEFVAGWLRVACLPLYLELAVIGTLALICANVAGPMMFHGQYAQVPGLEPEAGLLTVLVLAAMPWAGAWAGLGVSARSATRREAGAQMVGAALNVLRAWLVVAAVLEFLAALATAAFHLDFEPGVGEVLAATVLPAGALALATLWAANRGRRQTEVHVTDHWGEEVEGAVPPPAADTRHRRLLYLPGLALVLVVGTQVGVVVTLAGWGPFAPQTTWAGAPMLVVAISGAAVLVLWWLFRSLLDAVADRFGRRLPGAALLGGLLGGTAGAVAGSVPVVAHLLASAGLGASPGAAPVEPVAWAGLLGALIAAATTAASFLARPPAPASAADASAGHRSLVGLGFAAALAAAMGLVWWPALEAPVQRPVLERAVLAGVAAHEKALAAVPARENGFALLAPALMNYRGNPVQGGARVTRIIAGLKALSWSAVGYRQQILKALHGHPRQAARSAALLDATLPLVRAALARPQFVAPPRLADGTSARVPNFIEMRALSQSLVSRALMYEEQGRLDQALDTHLLNLRWSDRMAGQGLLITGMITVAMSAIAQDGLLDFLSRHRLAAADYARILRVLDGSRLTMPAFQQCVDDEFAFGLAGFDEMSRGASPEPELGTAQWMPRAWIQRERRAYVNVFLAQRGALADPRPEAPLRSEEGATAVFLRSYSLAAWITPNMARAFMQMRLILTQTGALRAVCQVERYRCLHGHYPAALEQATGGVRLADWFSPGGRFLYRRTDHGYRLWSASPVLQAVGVHGRQRVWMPWQDPG